MKMVAGNPDEPLDQEHIRIAGFEEHDDIAALGSR